MMTALWAVTGGGDFWPRWVWYGLAIPFGLSAALFGAWHVRRGRWRIFAVHAALFAWVTATLTLTWAMAGSDEFWPLIPVGCLAMILALHAVLAAVLGQVRNPRLDGFDRRCDLDGRAAHGDLTGIGRPQTKQCFGELRAT